jgi:GDPmannose 4,6-dehydratase
LTALIVGSTGQDGKLLQILFDKSSKSYLALDNTGIYKGNSIIESISNLTPKILHQLLSQYEIGEVFFLAGENDSYEIRNKVIRSPSKYFWTSSEILRMTLEAIEKLDYKIKFLFANSSLIFAGTTDTPQNENTIPKPLEEYASRKLIMSNDLHLFQNKNDHFELYDVIFYNHESIYRKPYFFTRKVIEFAVRHANSNLDMNKITIDRPEVIIDMSHARDFVVSAVNLMQSGNPGKYVFASGKGVLAKDFVYEVFDFLNLNVSNRVDFAEPNDELPLTPLIGDNTKIKSALGHLYLETQESLSVRLVKEWRRFLGYQN